MLRRLQRHFGFHRRELNGISGLLFLIVVIWLIPLLYSMFYEPDSPRIEVLEADWKDVEIDRSEELGAQASKQETVAHYFKFDPNDLPIIKWQQLGLKERQIKNIKNFEAKGGRFRKKDDLLKIYTISQDDYKRLEPYITIKSVETATRSQSDFPIRHPIEKIPTSGKAQIVLSVLDLNKIDSLSLLPLPGIGPVFASRIIRYRDLLGGFYSVSQLREVYGMDTIRYQQIEPYLKVDSTDVKRIAINSISLDELRKHPYIKAKYARLIVAYRNQHGNYKSLEDLSRIPVFDGKYLRKIAPYIIFDQ